MPPEDFEAVQAFLDDQGYGLVLVDALIVFVVVITKYTAHPDNIFKQSVIQRSADGYNCLLMTDQTAVEQPVHEGAIRLINTRLENPF